MRSITTSLLGGLTITGALAFCSALFIHYLPYRDLPMMPKPFFLYALSPGILASEMLNSRDHWMHESAFWVGNVSAYAIVVFLFIVLPLSSRKRGNAGSETLPKER
jgi:hypothetical protein